MTPCAFISLLETHRRLYHATDARAARLIGEQDAIALTFAPSTPADNKGDGLFYLSCSRIPHGGYEMSKTKENAAIKLELDADLLSHRYKIKPVAYWGDMAASATDPQQRRSLDENEDRVWSDQPYIKPASKYVLCVHIFIGNTQNEFVLEDLAAIQKTLPCAYYTDYGAYKSVDRRRSTPTWEPPAYELPYDRYTGDKDRWVRDAEPAIAWLQNPTDPANREFYHKRGYYRDYISSISCDLHNMRSYKTPAAQDCLMRFGRLIRKHGSLKKLVDWAQEQSYQAFR
jgi:hypothetical protein